MEEAQDNVKGLKSCTVKLNAHESQAGCVNVKAKRSVRWQVQLLKGMAVTTTSPLENEPSNSRFYSNEQNLEKHEFLCAIIRFSNVGNLKLGFPLVLHCVNLCSSNMHVHTRSHTPLLPKYSPVFTRTIILIYSKKKTSYIHCTYISDIFCFYRGKDQGVFSINLISFRFQVKILTYFSPTFTSKNRKLAVFFPSENQWVKMFVATYNVSSMHRICLFI